MTRKISLITFVAMLTVLFCAATANATDVLYTTLGPSGEYDTSSGYFVDGSNYFNQVLAMPFSPSSSEHVVDAVLALGNYDGGNSPINLYLESDDGLDEPGSILASFTQQGIIQPFSGGGGLVQFDCNSCPVVDFGTQYWIVAQEMDPNTEQAWMFAYQDEQGHGAFDQTGSSTGPWSQFDSTITGFRIDGGSGSQTPEPGGLMLLGTGLIGVAGFFRRRMGV
jgi:PEP-CTERM motif